ncbi:MAG TPA: hypothetical protein VMU54_16920 [Planctomycetota bacterium]|nr:hypothetical protein [Planctomycetota bacterium]
MRKTASNRGSALVLALSFLAISGLLLHLLTTAGTRVAASMGAQRLREEGLFEARGGIRWAVARWRSGGPTGPLGRTDPEGALRVEQDGERIRSTYLFNGGPLVTVSARWRGAPEEPSDWREE